MSERSNERQVAMEPTIAHNTQRACTSAACGSNRTYRTEKRRVLLLSSQLTKYAV